MQKIHFEVNKHTKVIDVSEIKVFVLDEADNMLDQDGLGDQTLRVKKCVLSFSITATEAYCVHSNQQHASSYEPCPNHPLLRHVPRPCSCLLLEIRTQGEQDRAPERGAER